VSVAQDGGDDFVQRSLRFSENVKRILFDVSRLGAIDLEGARGAIGLPTLSIDGQDFGR
jgi:hypothetical protein